jgi:hypothetical protein
LENLHDTKDTNSAWENIKEDTKISATDSLGLYEWKQRTLWFDEECSHYSGEQAKVQWLQDPNQSNVHHLNTVRREASRHVGNKMKEYLKAKINEFEGYQRLV